MEAAVILPPDYKPTEDEEYMNDYQIEYFRQKLENWKKELIEQSKDTLDDLRQGGLNQPDDIDRASMETDKAIDLRTKDRIRKLIGKINEVALTTNGRFNTLDSTIACLSGDVARNTARINNITKEVIPLDSLCPEAMPRYNSWVAPTNNTTEAN